MSRAAAHWYARRLEFTVLPRPAGERAPLIGWARMPDTPTSAAQIDAWWDRYPDAEVAWLVGDRFAVIDVDVRDTHDGRDELHELERAYRPLPDTPRALTPRDGVHIAFRLPPGVTVEPGVLAPGVDLRTGRRIIALPPGEGREWEIAPGELELAELPDWVIALATAVAASTNGNGAGRGSTSAPPALVPHGRRHDFLLDRATRYARGGIVDAREIEVLLEAEFGAYCEPLPPLEPGEIRGLAEWVANRCRIAARERNA